MIFEVLQHEPLSARQWFDRSDEVDLAPVYQRKSGLWNPEREALLIDSMLRGYDIPKLYLADFRRLEAQLNVQRRPYAVIDGKQRLETVFKFFRGAVRLSNQSALGDEEPLGVDGMTYFELRLFKPDLAERVEAFPLSVMSVVTDDEYRIHDLFVRLNYGQSVTAAERRNAMPGRAPVYIRRLANHGFFNNNIKFSTQRMEEFNVAAKLLLLEYLGRFADTKAANLDGLAKAWSMALDDKYLLATDSVAQILDNMSEAFRPGDPVLTRSGEIPVIYWLFRKGLAGSDVRQRLAAFYRSVLDNHRLSLVDPEAADPVLSNYYSRSRTTNDQGSLRDRFQILSQVLASG